MTHPKRGEVYWLDFNPSVGAEMSSMHPCIVVSNDMGNRLSALVIVIAVTSNLRVANLPIGVFLPAGTAGLVKDCVAHTGHVYTIDKVRLRTKIGDLPQTLLRQVDQALAVSLGL
jgi:mRNA interferase MazF